MDESLQPAWNDSKKDPGTGRPGPGMPPGGQEVCREAAFLNICIV